MEVMLGGFSLILFRQWGQTTCTENKAQQTAIGREKKLTSIALPVSLAYATEVVCVAKCKSPADKVLPA